MPRVAPAPNNQRMVNEAVEEFPEFPTGGGLGIESDLVSQFDETMSVTTDISDDDAAFMPSDMPVDDPFGASAEIAEEAMSADALIRPEKEDRHFKSIMAKNVNVLHASLDNIALVLSIVDGNTLVQGKAQSLHLRQEMNKLRSDVCASLSALSPPPIVKYDKADPQVVFTFSAPSAQSFAQLELLCRQLDLKLEDEIIAHLSAFVADEQVTENKLRFVLKLLDSKLEINDPKKPKPMRIRLKEVIIEQDED
ncbi:hypothetical protein PRIPAC_96560 [Pristionchus pacificus]|uniref:Uncharacterized protein n=1 Tax=Pristionchus pacificus TaxID=54126 RepID=A0A2A6CUF7_PRIPA|nr:hypothetical protein PRIPAC_96560 [Pristionchus pacificus]|eukprot:PDM81815.1 hypothetical protein PRIPAC_33969 [Pristionchus pacificus]